jgi:transposase
MTRQTFTKAFKLEAVRLLDAGKRPAAEIARELGIKREKLYRWREQLRSKGPDGFHDKVGRPAAEESAEVKRLKRELERVTEERDILKKAAAYFARDLP